MIVLQLVKPVFEQIIEYFSKRIYSFKIGNTCKFNEITNNKLLIINWLSLFLRDK